MLTTSSGIRLDLSAKDKEVKLRVALCCPWRYSKLIRAVIPRPSGTKPFHPSVAMPSQTPVVLSSQSSVVEPCQPSVMKSYGAKLQARVEVLRKKRSVKRKTLVDLESGPGTRAKISKLVVPSSSPVARRQGSFGQPRVRGRFAPSVVEVVKAAGLKPHLSPTTVRSSLGGNTDVPL